MADINRDDDVIELASPPRFSYGERVVARSVVRNDGTYNGKDIGEVLVNKGEIGYVININTFLQQFYIYAVDFVESGHRVGMRAKEICTLDNLPDDVLEQLGEKSAALQVLGSATSLIPCGTDRSTRSEQALSSTD
ncbi:nitrogen fixation protein NifZ [Rhodoferax ferrireducens]|uniref:nitrogen fixation protein NifZ n=1 Tax=Rhodoferax ferrireducens TaxID=192843 RepID=UPI003BB4B691